MSKERPDAMRNGPRDALERPAVRLIFKPRTGFQPGSLLPALENLWTLRVVGTISPEWIQV